GRSLSGMANEYDYQRFFWDLYSKEGLTLRNILDILARANTPTHWVASYEPGSDANTRPPPASSSRRPARCASARPGSARPASTGSTVSCFLVESPWGPPWC